MRTSTFLVVLAAVLGCASSFLVQPGKNEVALINLGGDAIMKIQLPSYDYEVHMLNRDAVRKCDAVPAAPIAAGRLEGLAGHALAYIGESQILSVNYTSHSYSILTCKLVLNANATDLPQHLSCDITTSSTSDIFTDTAKDIAYMEPNGLVLYDLAKGVFSVHNIHREVECKNKQTGTADQPCPYFESSPAFTGSLETVCAEHSTGVPSFRTTYRATGFGSNKLFVVCKSRDGFAVAKIVASTKSAAYEMSIAEHGKIRHDAEFEPLGAGLVMGYDPKNAKYRINVCANGACNATKDRVFGDKNAGCSRYLTQSECIADSECGFCVDTGKCQPTWGAQPCTGVCAHWIASNSNLPAHISDDKVSIEDKQIVYLSNDILIHFVPQDGTYKMFSVLADSPSHIGRCPGLSRTPLYQGSLPYKYHTASRFRENQILFHNSQSGHFAVWKCKDLTAITGNVGTNAPCYTTFSGFWPASIGVTQMIHIQNSTLVYSDETQQLSIFEVDDSKWDGSEGVAGSSLFPETPVHNYSLPALKQHKLIHVGSRFVLEYTQNPGDYRFWMFDPLRRTLQGPGSRGGYLPHKTFQMTWVGDNRLIVFKDDSQDYYLTRFDASMLAQNGPISFSSFARGTIGHLACNYSSCDTCTADPACGWCSSSNTCMPGNLEGPCNSGNMKKCSSWLKNYCAASSCASRQFRETCVADEACGWCESIAMCFRADSEGKPMTKACEANNFTTKSLFALLP